MVGNPLLVAAFAPGSARVPQWIGMPPPAGGRGHEYGQSEEDNEERGIAMPPRLRERQSRPSALSPPPIMLARLCRATLVSHAALRVVSSAAEGACHDHESGITPPRRAVPGRVAGSRLPCRTRRPGPASRALLCRRRDAMYRRLASSKRSFPEIKGSGPPVA
eukprot:gene13402-biopygen2280